MTSIELYEFAKQTVVMTAFMGIIIFGCASFFYVVIDTIVKAARLTIRFVKWVKSKNKKTEEVTDNE